MMLKTCGFLQMKNSKKQKKTMRLQNSAATVSIGRFAG